VPLIKALVQVPPGEVAEFAAATDSLAGQFTFNEVDGEIREIMNHFVQ
jgi:hypothetical protein